MLLLLQYNASADVHTLDGDTPLIVAASNGFEKVCRLILEQKPPINARGKHSLTAVITLVMKDD